MDIFIKEFLNNPGGKGSAVLNINATKETFTERYDKICKKISHMTFEVNKDIYILVNIPSSVDGIFYDVLMKFENTKKSIGTTITDMRMELFSNSPSFLYTYAYAYMKQNIFIKECKKKLSSKMLSDVAKTRNPFGVLSYDFSIYAALFYIVNNGYTNISDLQMNNYKKCSLSTVLHNVKDAEVLQKNRKIQKTANKLEEEEKLKKAKKNINKRINDKKSETDEIQDVEKVKGLVHVKSSKQVKKAKKI